MSGSALPSGTESRLMVSACGHGGSAPQVIILNKTAGVVCSRRDPEGRRTVFEDLPELRKGRWISIGRLDMQTTGLLLLTTDGELANRMMHPSTGLDREYAVRVNGRLDDETVEQLKIGMDVDGEMLSFSDVQYYDGTDNNAWYHVVLMEGKNREVRRLFEAVGCTVSRLKRVRYGPVILPSWLKNRQWAVLRPEDMKDLYKLLGLRYVTPKNDRKGHPPHAAGEPPVCCRIPNSLVFAGRSGINHDRFEPSAWATLALCRLDRPVGDMSGIAPHAGGKLLLITLRKCRLAINDGFLAFLSLSQRGVRQQHRDHIVIDVVHAVGITQTVADHVR